MPELSRGEIQRTVVQALAPGGIEAQLQLLADLDEVLEHLQPVDRPQRAEPVMFVLFTKHGRQRAQQRVAIPHSVEAPARLLVVGVGAELRAVAEGLVERDGADAVWAVGPPEQVSDDLRVPTSRCRHRRRGLLEELPALRRAHREDFAELPARRAQAPAGHVRLCRRKVAQLLLRHVDPFLRIEPVRCASDFRAVVLEQLEVAARPLEQDVVAVRRERREPFPDQVPLLGLFQRLHGDAVERNMRAERLTLLDRANHPCQRLSGSGERLIPRRDEHEERPLLVLRVEQDLVEHAQRRLVAPVGIVHHDDEWESPALVRFEVLHQRAQRLDELGLELPRRHVRVAWRGGRRRVANVAEQVAGRLERSEHAVERLREPGPDLDGRHASGESERRDQGQRRARGLVSPVAASDARVHARKVVEHLRSQHLERSQARPGFGIDAAHREPEPRRRRAVVRRTLRHEPHVHLFGPVQLRLRGGHPRVQILDESRLPPPRRPVEEDDGRMALSRRPCHEQDRPFALPA